MIYLNLKAKTLLSFDKYSKNKFELVLFIYLLEILQIISYSRGSVLKHKKRMERNEL
jgi:hypothetical protein